MTNNKKIYTSNLAQARDQNLHNIHTFGCDLINESIYLNGYFDSAINDEPGVDYRQATSFIKNLNILTQLPSSNILIHMISIGGDWNYGLGIYDAIKTCETPTTILAHATAPSMSSIILQGADIRVLMPNCEFMVHNGHISGEFTYGELISEAEIEKKRQTKMLEIYASRCIAGPFFKKKSYSINQVIDYLNKKILQKSDWWLFADEAVDYGFADGILGTPNFTDTEEIRAKIKCK